MSVRTHLYTTTKRTPQSSIQQPFTQPNGSCHNCNIIIHFLLRLAEYLDDDDDDDDVVDDDDDDDVQSTCSPTFSRCGSDIIAYTPQAAINSELHHPFPSKISLV